MDRVAEQTVYPKSPAKGKLITALMWVLMLVLVFAGRVMMTNMVVPDGNGGVVFIWWRALIAAALLGLVVLCFLRRDIGSKEYDYSFVNDEIEICCVYGGRRRKRLANFWVDDITSCGYAEGPAYTMALNSAGGKKHNWTLNSDETAYYISYSKQDGKHTARLELNEEIAHLIRTSKDLPRGAWHDKEGRSSDYAGIS